MDDDLRKKLEECILGMVKDQRSYGTPEPGDKMDADFMDSFSDMVIESEAVGIINEQIARYLFRDKK